MSDYNIYEVLEFVNDYLQESKGNALDKVYGKDLAELDKLTAQRDELERKFGHSDRLAAKKNEKANELNNKLQGKIIKNHYNYPDSNSASIGAKIDALRRRNNGETLDNRSRSAIKNLKNELGIGKDPLSHLDSKYHVKPGYYLDRYKAIKDGEKKAKEKKSSSDHKITVYNSVYDPVDTRLAVYEACDAGFITEEEKYCLLNLLED